MRTFVWDVKYALGVAELDAQHKRLFAVLRELQLESYGDISGEDLADKISQMQCYCYEHFIAEESHMRMYTAQLPMLEEHIAQHENFLAVTNAFAIRAKVEGTQIAHEVCSYLGSWLVSHIYTMDKRTFAAIQALDASNPVASFERPYDFDTEAMVRHKGKIEHEKILDLRAGK